MGHRSGADALVTGSHIDSPDFLFAMAVGEQSSEAVVIRCRKFCMATLSA